MYINIAFLGMSRHKMKVLLLDKNLNMSLKMGLLSRNG